MKTNKNNKGTTKAGATKNGHLCDVSRPLGKDECSLFHELSPGLKALLATITKGELKTINAELAEVAITMLAAAPALRALRPRIEEELPRFDLRAFDAIEEIAWAGINVQTTWNAVSSARDELPALFREATELRDGLLSDCAPHVRRGEIPREPFEALAKGTAYQDAMETVGVLGAMLRAAWPQIEGRTVIEFATVERCRSLSREILEAMAKRDARDVRLEKLAFERQQMFTLMLGTYQQARRAVEYLRFNERDADAFAPSVFAKRGGTRRKEVEVEEEAKAPEPAGKQGGEAVTKA